MFLVGLASPAVAEPSFTPIAVPEHQYTGGWEHFVGGGLAAFDCNGDSLPELFAAGGASPASLFVNTSPRGAALSFTKKTPESLAIKGLTGAYPLDIDGDGWTDLVLLSEQKNRLMKGRENCTFSEFANLTLPSEEKWTTAFSAIWEPQQTLPTLAFGNYVDRTNPKGPFGTCDGNQLFRPTGGAYGTAIALEPGFCALSLLFSDWSRSARPELRVSNDRHYYVKGGAEQLWRMGPTPELVTEAEGWQPHELWGMGIASRDVTGDGLPDVYLSSMGDQRLQVLQSADAPTWQDAPYEWGTTAHRPHVGEDGRPSTGWHTAFGDVQNDGMDDIFVSKGNVEQMPGSAMQDPNSLLVATQPRVWVEKAGPAGVASMFKGRGAALVDLNLDGLLDLAVVNRRAPLEVWQNTSDPSGHFVALRLQQDSPNKDAIGSWIELSTGKKIIAREVTVGGGHAGGVLGPEHFGLGAATDLRVRVTWPDGLTSDWSPISHGTQNLVTRNGNSLRIEPY